MCGETGLKILCSHFRVKEVIIFVGATQRVTGIRSMKISLKSWMHVTTWLAPMQVSNVFYVFIYKWSGSILENLMSMKEIVFHIQKNTCIRWKYVLLHFVCTFLKKSWKFLQEISKNKFALCWRATICCGTLFTRGADQSIDVHCLMIYASTLHT